MHKFVDLDRSFVPIRKGEEPTLDAGRVWGGRLFGWLTWPELLTYPRAVLLAEAGSGKTEELKAQVVHLKTIGEAVFFLRVEDIAEGDFSSCLSPKEREQFQSWCQGNSKGFFFLDSIDEARLNGDKFHRALQRTAEALEGQLQRSHIIVSCRVSDWKGDEDRNEIETWLPIQIPTSDTASKNTRDLLLAPIFDLQEIHHVTTKDSRRAAVGELLLVQMAPLFADQRRKLGMTIGVQEIDAFEEAIVQNGLEGFADRPGDVIALAEYWKTNGRFSSLQEMTEYALNLRLNERNSFRPDNAYLPADMARCGAERLAAALTLGKSFTIKAPGSAGDSTLGSGAIDPAEVSVVR